jgi:autotransporter strand-loop-strand O-heptosyltransferase
MRILQITPGIIPIPPNGWGAVEKIIWEYKLSLDRAGWPTDIVYSSEVEPLNNQIVHVHMANLANELNSRQIPYVFSLHDHHVEHFGRESACYRENYEAIKNSKLCFVHSRHLIEYFDNMPQIVYLEHGANLADYEFFDRSGRLLNKNPKLLMMANNGVGGDPLVDRKGFLIGIEAARQLGLEITIICPSSNRAFFEHHVVNYEKLNILYDLEYRESLSIMPEFDIFIHPSNLEAGHPNLTITESIALGIPVVAVCNSELGGMIRVERGVYPFIQGIKTAISSYDSLIGKIIAERDKLSWDIITSKMLEKYKNTFSIGQDYQLINSYKNTALCRSKINSTRIFSSFSGGRAFVKTAFYSPGCVAIFRDRRRNRIEFHCEISKSPGNWAYKVGDSRSFIDWEILIKSGTNVIYRDSLELTGKRVLLEINHSVDRNTEELVREFALKTGCLLTIRGSHPILKFGHDPNADPENFYYSLTYDQLVNYSESVEKIPEKILFYLVSNALGDTIGFLPYAQKWAEKNGKIVDVAINFANIFDLDKFRNLNIIKKSEVNYENYTDISKFEYDFYKPLQLGYSDQFSLEPQEERAQILKVGKDRPIKNKYVVLGVHTTAQSKYWNYPNGWEIISKWLRKMGYTPVAIDLHEVFGIEGHWNYLPNSALKKTGIDLLEVINYLEHCEFFIGVSSGLSWLSWAIGKKVVMISGVTGEFNEFISNNYRVIKRSVCNGCINSKKYVFDPGDWLWCPEHRDTERHFECTTSITPEMVIEKIEEVIEDFGHNKN